MELNIKLLNSQRPGEETFSVDCPLETSVLDLKKRLTERTEVPEERQRLIYRGRVLQDDHTLSQSGLETGHTLHCVVRPAGVPAAQPEASAQAGMQTEAAGARRMMMGAFQGTPGLLRESRLLSDIFRLGDNAQPGRQGRPGERGEAAAVTNPNSLEHIRQGLLTMHTMLSGMEAGVSGSSSRERTEEQEEETQPPAAPTVAAEGVTGGSATAHAELSQAMCGRRRFFVGQWLDVKDTVSQWLEATVMEVNAERETLKIHYNGWPVRWDEWLPFNSQRIAPFRTRTVHGFQAPFMSPFPVSAVRNAPVTGQDDIRVVLPEVLGMVRRVSTYLENLSSMCEDDLLRQPSTTTEMEQQPARPWLEASLPWEAERAREEERRRRRKRREADDEEKEETAEEQEQQDGDQKMAGGEEEEAGEEANTSGEVRRPRKRPIHAVASDVAPLLDRCGRLLADLAPHVSTLAASRGPNVRAPEDATSAPPATEMEVEAPTGASVNESGSSSRSARTGRSAARERGGTRSRTPSPDTAFRQLIAVSSRAGPLGGLPGLGNNIDIHIHAFLAPVGLRMGAAAAATTTTTQATQGSGTSAGGVLRAPTAGNGDGIGLGEIAASMGLGELSRDPQFSQADDPLGLLDRAWGLQAETFWGASVQQQQQQQQQASTRTSHGNGTRDIGSSGTSAHHLPSMSGAGGSSTATAGPNAMYGVLSSASLMASPTNAQMLRSTSTPSSAAASGGRPPTSSSSPGSSAAGPGMGHGQSQAEGGHQGESGGSSSSSMTLLSSILRRFSS